VILAFAEGHWLLEKPQLSSLPDQGSMLGSQENLKQLVKILLAMGAS
jgi:hypothetical protein